MNSMFEELGEKYGITYNPPKSMYMKIGSNISETLPQSQLSGNRREVSWSEGLDIDTT